jgi:multisubunit Na+/H+ antiporter MnhF subunit
MADRSDILLEYWRDQRTQARNTESQRAVLANLVLLIAAAILGLVAQAGIKKADAILTLLLVLLGLLGAMASAKYYERYNLHIDQAVRFSSLLSSSDAQTDYEAILAPVRDSHAEEYRILSRVRLNKLWLTIHILIALAGCGLTAAILV